MRDDSRKQRGSGEAQEDLGQEHAQRPAPGKVTRTSMLAGRSGQAVQRKTPAPGVAALDRRSALDQTLDADMDAAHRGVRAHAAGAHATGAAARGAAVQRVEDGGEPKLLIDFARDFPAAADLIRKSKEATALVREAAAAKVEYGGYAEDGPAKNSWPYTVSNKVYIPKARVDAVLAMSDFLFELNNGIRAPTFKTLNKEAAKGSKGSLDAKKYAYQTVAQEVEGMLRLGKVWIETRKSMKGNRKLDQYDADFYRSEYEDYVNKKKTKDDIVKDVLQREYTGGVEAGKTVEQFYMEQYQSISGGK